MQIENKNKRKMMSEWLQKTGNGPKRRLSPVTEKARRYMHTPPYCGMFQREVKDAPD